MKQQTDNIDIYYNSFEYFQKLEKSLADNLGLSELKSGGQVIRNSKGWRENERSIEYIWVVQISRCFVGWGGLFSIKFNENKFREHINAEELVQGLFICNQNGIDKFYSRNISDNTKDITSLFKFNLFTASNAITLDGVSYNLRIIAPNIDTFIHLNNPNNSEWKKWEQEIWTLGKELANNSNQQEMINLFE